MEAMMQEGSSKKLLQRWFDSNPKRGSIAGDMGDDKVRIYAKGAPDFLIKNCINF
jgi:magnesium-transporting ATPase (P-type)